MNRRFVLGGLSALAVSAAVAVRPRSNPPQVLAWLDEDTERARAEFALVLDELGGEEVLRTTNTEVRWIESDYENIDSDDLANKIRREGAHVCFAVFHHAATTLQRKMPELRQVVLSILDPIEVDIIDDYFAPGRNTTGVSLDPLDPHKPFEALRAFFRSDKQPVIGVLAAKEWGTERRKAMCNAAARDLSVTVEFHACDAPSDGARLIAENKAIDAWWIPESWLVETSAKRAGLISAVRESGKPHVFGRPKACDEGAILALSSGPSEWYRPAAHVLRMVLEGVTPSHIPFQLPTGWVYTANERAFNSLGYQIPPEIAVMLAHQASGVGRI